MAPEIIAVILCGGESKRMGKPKASLNYHQLPQYKHLLNICNNVGLSAYLSCRKTQVDLFAETKQIIPDNIQFANAGPFTGLLSAIEIFPQNAILLLGCDYPAITGEDLAILIEHFYHTNCTVSYYHEENNIDEPLLAIYHPKDFNELKLRFRRQQNSLRQFLNESRSSRIKPKHIGLLKSYDTEIDFNSFIEPTNA
jgi:molybdenum cofactor guanylyltransferase